MCQIMNREVTFRMCFCRDFACSVSTGGVYRGLIEVFITRFRV